MLACPPDISLRLYEDALLDLGRAARAFSAAIERAADAGQRVDDGEALELAARVLEDCRSAVLPALARAPGMLQIFAALAS